MKTVLKKIARALTLLVVTGLFLSFANPMFSQGIWPQEQSFSISEPENVSFYVEYNGPSAITGINYYYWDEESEEMQTLYLNPLTDYELSDDYLIITQSFIEGLDPNPGQYMMFDAVFDETILVHFGIHVTYTFYPYLYPTEKSFDISNIEPVFTSVALLDQYQIVSLSYQGNQLQPSQYSIIGNRLFIHASYLAGILTASGQSAEFLVNFEGEITRTFTVNAIQTGVVKAQINPNSFDIDMNNAPEYFDAIITWNDAGSVENMTVGYIEDGYPEEFDYPAYEITPINAQTSQLRIYFGGEKSSQAKAIDNFYATVTVNFDAGGPAYIFLNMWEEYYYVNADYFPWNGGWVQGSGEYGPGEEVSLLAVANEGYDFVKWIVGDDVEITDNPYEFIMGSEDVYVTAVFLGEFPEVLYSSPTNGDTWVDINTSLYLYFDRNIMEGSSNNGFGDISLIDNFGNPWGIASITIEDGNTLVIEPNLPLNTMETYNLNVPPWAVEDASNPGLSMNNPFMMSFTTGMGYFDFAYIFPYYLTYSILEPNDMAFNIYWGDETSIEKVFYFYEDEEYFEMQLNESTDYVISGDLLIITQEFIESMNPNPGDYLSFYTEFGGEYTSYFGIEIIYSDFPFITPETQEFDLSNQEDVFTYIVYNSATSISQVSGNGVLLEEDVQFRIQDSWLFIESSYLSTVLQAVNDEVEIVVVFDDDNQATLTITAIETGSANPEIDPQSASYYEDEIPQYLDITITWNDASSVENLFIWFIDGSVVDVFEYPYYEVIPIDGLTSLLRIDLYAGGAKSLNNEKDLYVDNVIIEIEFNTGVSKLFYLTVLVEFYQVYIEVVPENTGYVWGNWDYSVGEEVTVGADPFLDYTFQSWRQDGVVVSTNTEYSFVMPANHVYLTAHFVSSGTQMYQLSLSSNPVSGGEAQGAGMFAAGETTSIAAVPAEGFAFVNWTDGGGNVFATDAEYSFTMPENNLSLTANFIDNSSVTTQSMARVKVFPNPFDDVIHIEEFESASRLTITDITGKRIFKTENILGQIQTGHLPTGFYLLIFEDNNGNMLVRKMVKQ